MLATLVTSLVTRSVPQYTFAEYTVDGVDATSASTELIALPIPRQVTRLDLKVIAVDCTSSDFDFILLDKNDIFALNTIHEVLRYGGESYNFSDNNFSSYIIVNRDVTEVNRLYVYIRNNSNVPTGQISIRLVYLPVSTGETM
jgi:hypothetical protein